MAKLTVKTSDGDTVHGMIASFRSVPDILIMPAILLCFGLNACVSSTPTPRDEALLRQRDAETQTLLAARELSRFAIARYASLTEDPQTASREYQKISPSQMRDPVIADRALFSTLLVGRVDQAARLASALPLSTLAASDLARLTLAVDAIADDQPDRAHSWLAAEWRSPFHASLAGSIKAWLVFEHMPEAGIALQTEVGFGNPLLQRLGETLAARMKVESGDIDGALADFAALWLDRAGTAIGIETEARLLARSGQTTLALARLDGFRETVGRHPALSALAEEIKTNRVSAPVPLQPRRGMALFMYAAAAALSQQHDSDVAAVYFALALHLDPQLDAARSLWADALDRSGRRTDAVELLQAISPSSVYYTSAQGQLAWILLRDNQTERALDLARTTLETHPDRNIQIQYGDLLRASGRIGQAIAVFSDVIEADAAAGAYDWRLYFARGAAREQLGFWAPAESDLETALGLNPTNPEILNYLGYSWIDRGLHLERALGLIEQALILAPDSGAITDSLGWAFYRLGQYDRAVYHLERATELDPRNAGILDHLGDAYWQTGRYSEAGYQWQRALDLAATDTDRAAYAAKLTLQPTPDLGRTLSGEANRP